MTSYSSSRFDLKVQKDFGIQLTESQLRLHQRIHGITPTAIASERPVEHAGSETPMLRPEVSKPQQDENDAVLLKNALNKSNIIASKRYSTGAGISTADQKAMLRKILTQKRKSRAESTLQKSHPSEFPASRSQTAPEVEQNQNDPLRNREASKSPVRHPTTQKQDGFHQMKPPPRVIPTALPLTKSPPQSEASASTKNGKEEQRALMRKVLENSRAKRLTAADQRISPRASLIESQRKSLSKLEQKREPLAMMRKPVASRDQARQSPRSSMMAYRRKSMAEFKSDTLIAKPKGLPLGQQFSTREKVQFDTQSSKENNSKSINKSYPNYEKSIPIQSASRLSPKKVPQIAQRTADGHLLSLAGKRGIPTDGPIHAKHQPTSPFHSEISKKPPTLNVVTRVEPTQEVSDKSCISPSRLKLPPPELELDSYTAFISVLKQEGANDHRELFRSFRSIFCSGRVELTDKVKRVKFDAKTKKTLTEMNLYLKRASDVECKAESQLVNDKNYLREKSSQSLSPVTPILRVQQSQESSSEASSAQHLSEVKMPTTWMTSMRVKQKPDVVESISTRNTEEAHAVHHNAPSDPVDRQTSWLAAHREKQQQKPPHKEASDKQNIASPGSGRKRRIDERQSTLPPWAKVQLKSRVDASTENRDDLAEKRSVPWSRVQLRETKVLMDSTDNTDENDDDAMVSRNVPLSLGNEVHLDQNQCEIEEGKVATQSVLNSRSKSRKDPEVRSFVPTANASLAPVPWSKKLLKPVEEHQPEENHIAPWAQIKLRKRANTAPDVSKHSTSKNVWEARTPTREFKSENVSTDNQLEGSMAHPSNQEPKVMQHMTPSKSIHGALSEMLVSRHRQSPKSEKLEEVPTADSSVSTNVDKEASPIEVKNALSNMLAARLGSLRHTDIAEGASSGPTLVTPSRNTLTNGNDNRLSPASKAEQTTEEARSASNQTSTVDFKSSLSSILPVRTPQKVDPGKTQFICVDDVIDLNCLSQEVEKLLKNFVLIELSSVSGDLIEVVILGSDLIVVGTSLDDTSTYRVLWLSRRSSIESITLDLARNVADLFLSGDSQQSLKFRSTEGCLRFAACFYQTADVVSNERTHSKSTSVSAGAHGGEQLSATEQLNKEEQKLLERFREARKVRDADDLLKAMIGGEDNDTSLSEDDQKTVDKYMKMLRMRIPPDAVEHKMMRDCVDQRLIDIVLQQEKSSSQELDSLSEAETEIAEKYRKMLRMQIPKEAVQHKMTKDGIDQKVVNAVLSSEIPQQPEPVEPPLKLKQQSNEFLPEEEALIASYRKMLKMCIPPDAIRHKMKKDEASEKVRFAVFPEDAKEESASNKEKQPKLTEEEQKASQTYLKMLKMGIPEDGVRHKMMKDGVSLEIVRFVLGGESTENKSSNGLSADEEKAVASYRKMIKMHFPEEAVRHKMAKEGASEKVVGMVFDVKKDEVPPISNTNKGSLRGSNLVALHWTPLSGEELDNSVWRASKKQRVAGAQPGTNDISKLIELFKKKSNTKDGIASGPVLTSDEKGKAKLIDLNRANNIAISLKAFKDFTYQELVDTIAYLDPQELISGERVSFVKDLLPNIQERQAIKAYTGEDTRLVPAEIFFRRVIRVKRIEIKVEVMKTMVTFKTNTAGLIENYQILERACCQAQKSEKLQELLEMVLYVGNIMNEGTRTGGAAGFKFDSLLKLTQTKSFDGKTTVLDYLVMIFVAKNKRAIIDIKSDFLDCQTASRILISDMNMEVKALSDALQKCKTELQALKQENGLVSEAKTKVANKRDTDPMAALLAAIKARGPQGECNESQATPSKSKAASSYLDAINARKDTEKSKDDEIKKPGKLNLDVIKEKCNLDGEKEESSLLDKVIWTCTTPDFEEVNDAGEFQKESQAPLSPLKAKRPATIEGGINRLDDFITKAEEVLSKLQASKDRALAACRTLAKYCGESGGEQSATTLLGILYEFATNLSDALKKYDMRLELEAKKAVQKQRLEQQTRRKRFVESKGFGEIVASKEASLPEPLSSDFDGLDTSCDQISPQLKLREESTSLPSDVSQVQSDAKAKRIVRKAGDRTSLVAMVNKMLKEATPQVRQDFQAGVIYENIEDETLKAIYEKERASLLRSPPRRRLVSGELDLMSAIKQRRNQAESIES